MISPHHWCRLFHDAIVARLGLKAVLRRLSNTKGFILSATTVLTAGFLSASALFLILTVMNHIAERTRDIVASETGHIAVRIHDVKLLLKRADVFHGRTEVTLKDLAGKIDELAQVAARQADHREECR